MTAYDYDKQEWVSGSAAKVMRHKQLLTHYDAMTGPDALNYCRFVGIKDRAAEIAKVQLELAALEDGL